jgi:hypothetical protein
MSKTVNVPDDWTPDKKPVRRPQWAFDVDAPHTVEGDEHGWRLVGVDENGQKIYAPPARYSIWSS